MTPRKRLLLPAGALAAAGMAFLAVSNAPVSSGETLRAQGDMTARLGVNVHGFTSADAARMQRMGLGYVRLTLNWSKIETRRGAYDWREVDERVAAVASRGMRPVLILAYSNPLYAGRSTKPQSRTRWQAPASAEARSAFARWAAAAAGRYARLRPVWEIWNEPDTEGFWPDRVDPQAYSDLALETCQKIRTADADAEVWGPALSSLHNRSAADSPFFRAVLSTRLPACLSAISVHPYLHWSQIDGAVQYWRSVAAVPATSRRPLVNSEAGISNYGTRITDYTQASYLVRMIVYDHMAGVRATLWYDWKDDGDNPTNPEHHFGLLDGKGNDKPAMKALELFASTMRGLDRQCLEQSRGVARLYAWRVGAARDVTAVIWRTTNGFSTDPAGEVVLDTNASTIDARDMLGMPANVTRDQGRWRISGGRMPYYVRYRADLPPGCGR